MRRISLLAILVGAAVSYVAPAILAMLIGMAVGIFMTYGSHAAPALAMQQIIWNPYYYYGILAIQLLFGFLGGYLAGVTARHDEVLNGLLSSLTVVLITASFHALDPHPVAIHILKNAGFVVASTLGGYLRALEVHRKALRANPARLPHN
jgi:hypothetical protein